MKYFLFCFFTAFSCFSSAVQSDQSLTPSSTEESDDIYWDTPYYLSKLEESQSKIQYVYHLRNPNFTGNFIVPLNMMPHLDGFDEIYKKAISKYKGREHLLTKVIPTLNCLWNDVIFLSPVHPHLHYLEYQKIGFKIKKVQSYKIPIDILKEKRVTVWKWLSYKKYPSKDPIHESIESYCDLDFSRYQERDDLPEDTKEFYRKSFNPEDPSYYPRFHWYRIPHILCQDIIDTYDPRITIIDWEDPIER